MRMTACLPSEYHQKVECFFDFTPVMEVKPFTPVYLSIKKPCPIEDSSPSILGGQFYFSNVSMPLYEAMRIHLFYRIDDSWRITSKIVPIEKENLDLNDHLYRLLYHGDSGLYDFFMMEKELFLELWKRLLMDALSFDEYYMADIHGEFDKIKQFGIMSFGPMPKNQRAML